MNCTAKCLKKTVNDDVPTEAADLSKPKPMIVSTEAVDLSKLEKEKLHSFD
ncbi:MAG: hypothetical protein GX918_03995 [Clostridiales bacterium]|jgi:hypothetical protein|nr:hypothetical protein [Clostridiales bacterium]